MNSDKWTDIVITILGLGVTTTLGLIGILFSWLKSRIDNNEKKAADDLKEFQRYVNDRLRSLGHEDRDIRTKVDGLWKLFVDITKKGKNGD